MRSARPRDYVGQGTGAGCRSGMRRVRVSPFPVLRIVFIARPLSLTADFYSVSLHKSAYDILCAPARKIVRNFSRARARPGRYSQFFNFHSGPRLPSTHRSFSPSRPRRTLANRGVCVRAFFSCRRIYIYIYIFFFFEARVPTGRR